MIDTMLSLPAEADGEAAGNSLLPRPRRLRGATYRTETPLGTAFITVNWKEAGSIREPFEVFLNIGKAGTDIAALAEAIGRLCSLCLRLPGQMPPQERVAAMVGQLAGIGGERSVGFGAERVRSLPDAVARVLSEAIDLAVDRSAAFTSTEGPESLSVNPSLGEPPLVDTEDDRGSETDTSED